jgi:hypothetical protein
VRQADGSGKLAGELAALGGAAPTFANQSAVLALTAGPLATRYGKLVADEPVEQLDAGAHLGDPVPRALTDSAGSPSGRG